MRPACRMRVIGFGMAAVVLAFAAAVIGAARRPRPCRLSIVLALVVASGLIRPPPPRSPGWPMRWRSSAMLCLVVSGMLDDVRPRVVAGWIGLAGTIAADHLGGAGSLLRRAVFLAIAGLVAVALASLLGRFIGRERRPMKPLPPCSP